MGADIHIVVGRINLAAIENRPILPKESQSTALALFNPQRDIRGEDFDLWDLDEEFEVDRHYGLFSFLANVRGNVKPLLPVEERREKTSKFLHWLEQQQNVKQVGWYSDAPFMYQYDFGDHSRIIHLVRDLLEFDYDQVVLMEDPKSDFDNPIYFRHEEGMTYREMFAGAGWFKFLDYCKSEECHFAIFGFDS